MTSVAVRLCFQVTLSSNIKRPQNTTRLPSPPLHPHHHSDFFLNFQLNSNNLSILFNMVKASFALLVASMALLLSSTVESAPVELATSGMTAALISATQYCLFLPPNKGGNIADSEDSAIAFCNVAIPTAPKAKILPSGFIKSVHFVTNASKGYVQITGKIDRSKYGLSASDGGGQYDLRAPVGSACAGYSSFVQFVEPDVQIYCLRCCKNKSDCPTNKSTDGCESVLGGDYS